MLINKKAKYVENILCQVELVIAVNIMLMRLGAMRHIVAPADNNTTKHYCILPLPLMICIPNLFSSEIPLWFGAKLGKKSL